MDWTGRVSSFLARRSQRSLLLITAVAIVAIWLFDYLSGPVLSVSIFYLLPVGLASWYAGRRAGVLTAGVCAIAWLFNDLATNPASVDSFLPYWNASVRLATFLLVADIVSSLYQARKRQEELITFLVHDLRTPVFNVMSSLEMIRHANSSGDQESMDQFIDVGLSSGNNMLNLIDTLLDLARLENRRMPVDLQPVEVTPLIHTAIQQVSALTELQEVQVAVHKANDIPIACADPALLARVLVNLLSNAVKVSPKHSTIDVDLRPVNGAELEITIRDEGPGIPSQWRQKAFQKYRQVQARKEGKAVGSGLGLAFCRLAVEAQNGRIWLEGAEPSGTRVHLRLPLDEQSNNGI